MAQTNLIKHTATGLRRGICQVSAPFVVACAALFTSSCSVTRDVPEGELLLNKVKVEVEIPQLKSELKSLLRQKPNQRLLFIYRFKLRFFSAFFFGKDSDSKLRYAVGEPPVLYDSSSTQHTASQMSAYMRNKGYYRNTVDFTEIRTRAKSRKVRVVYKVTPGLPTIIAGINTEIGIDNVHNDLTRESEKTLIRVGDNFDSDKLEQERNRLVRIMQNQGYFFFSNDLVYFHADTIRESYKAYLTYRINENPVKFFGDSILVKPYSTYKIRNIYVRQDFGERFTGISEKDTVGRFGYSFINEPSFTVKPKIISRSIFHSAGDFYIMENHENTYRRLTALNNYKYVNISYTKKGEDAASTYLNCLISLAPGKPKSFSFETNGTSTGGILGVNGTLSVSHRNAFRGAEMLRLSVYGGMEAQSVKSGDDVVQNTPFNTVEIGPELSLTFPKFLLPVDQNRFSKRNIPKTTLSLAYNFQQRPDYTRNIISAGLVYSWRESRTKSHAIQPLNISQVKIFKSDEFQKRLDELDNSSLKASYEDNFITSVSYSFVFNDQTIDRGRNYNIFRANVESAGNLIYAIDKNGAREPDVNGQYTVNNIPYAQFFRTYVEYIHNLNIGRKNFFVNRTFIGAGVPYGNSNAMPFVRSFYGGGTNGIRAWQARSLGPGSIPNEDLESASVDQIGDIKLELNLELRFGIIKYLEGALFTDMGNIWVLDNPAFNQAGNFKFSRIWHDAAIGAGLGARLNFEYFVIRLDVARRVKDPGSADPMAIKFFYPEPPVYNFAIGYPF